MMIKSKVRPLKESDLPYFLLLVEEATNKNNMYVKVEKVEEFFYMILNSDDYFVRVYTTKKDEPIAMFVGFVSENFFNDCLTGADIFWYSLKKYNVNSLKLLQEFEKWCIERQCTEILLDIVPDSGFNKLAHRLDYVKAKIGYRRVL